ncbi:MAG: pyridoxal-phosphate dependent enzyme, partial [Thermoleophilia bacterium]|nr:pyridoxal-phosphate dependent enzyme [Thermoleophilia bacterium]
LVVMWRGASEQKIEAARAYGATVDLTADGSPQAFERLEQLLAETGRTLLHPFDDPRVIAGQGTVGLEVLEDVARADVVLVPVGGGGLVSGIALAVKGLRPDARVVAVEPERSPALHEALRAGRPVEVHPTSIADGLGAPHAGRNAYAICAALGVESVLVGEEQLASAFRFLYARAKLACEAAGAATTAALLARRVPLAEGERVVAVVSGGNIGPEQASAILAER